VTIERAKLQSALHATLGIKPAKRARTGEQDRFMLLHARRFVTKWQWLFRGAMLRAEASDGLTATISADGLRELVTAGLMRQGQGFDVQLTAAGVDLLKGRAT
jgi:hypothetical protein